MEELKSVTSVAKLRVEKSALTIKAIKRKLFQDAAAYHLPGKSELKRATVVSEPKASSDKSFCHSGREVGKSAPPSSLGIAIEILAD